MVWPLTKAATAAAAADGRAADFYTRKVRVKVYTYECRAPSACPACAPGLMSPADNCTAAACPGMDDSYAVNCSGRGLGAHGRSTATHALATGPKPREPNHPNEPPRDPNGPKQRKPNHPNECTCGPGQRRVLGGARGRRLPVLLRGRVRGGGLLGGPPAAGVHVLGGGDAHGGRGR